MRVTKETCGAVLLAGGKSRRMGRCKALLEVEGATLLQRTVRMLTGFEELWRDWRRPSPPRNRRRWCASPVTCPI